MIDFKREDALDQKRDYAKARRAAATAAGLCVSCCKQPAARGIVKCESCRSYQNGYMKRSGAHYNVRASPRAPIDRFNVCCAAHGFHRADCRAS